MDGPAAKAEAPDIFTRIGVTRTAVLAPCYRRPRMDHPAPRVTVAFAMFCDGYDPDYPTDLRRLTTGVSGWTAAAPPTVDLTLAIGLWNAGAPGPVRCRIGIRRPDEGITYIGEGDAMLEEPGELAIMPLKLTLTCDRPGTSWGICEIAGKPLVEVPFTVRPASEHRGS